MGGAKKVVREAGLIEGRGGLFRISLEAVIGEQSRPALSKRSE